MGEKKQDMPDSSLDISQLVKDIWDKNEGKGKDYLFLLDDVTGALLGDNIRSRQDGSYRVCENGNVVTYCISFRDQPDMGLWKCPVKVVASFRQNEAKEGIYKTIESVCEEFFNQNQYSFK